MTGAATCFDVFLHGSVPLTLLALFDRQAQRLPCAAGPCPAAIFTLFPATCGANERKIAPDGRLGQRLAAHLGGGEG